MPETTGVPQGFSPEKMFERVRAERAAWAAQETKGQRFIVPREGKSLAGVEKEGISTILYRPANVADNTKLPMLFNMHGGAWFGGDAVLMETFCQLLADELPAMIVNVNYQKADVKPFPYAIEEVADAVCYFAEHAQEYGIDPARMAVGGHSAGAQLAAGTALMLKERGVKLAAQMLVYPCVDMSAREGLMGMIGGLLFPEGGNPEYYGSHRWASPLLATDEELAGVAPAIFVECGPDDLKPQGIAYAKRLIDLGVPVTVREFAHAEHGFLEVNRPDYTPGDPRQTPEQAEYARECERYLVGALRMIFAM